MRESGSTLNHAISQTIIGLPSLDSKNLSPAHFCTGDLNSGYDQFLKELEMAVKL